MKNKRQKIFFILSLAAIFLALLLSAFPLAYSENEKINALLQEIIPLLCALPLPLFFLITEEKGLFAKPKHLLWLAPCLLVAINNLPWSSLFKGDCTLDNPSFSLVFLFACYCLTVGLFEECIFRGLLFPFLLDRFPKNKKGFLASFFLSSCLFGLAHLVNLFYGAPPTATLLQVLYTTLVGGLCAFALWKTQNIFSPVLVHFLYNFCGLLLDNRLGLGSGLLFDCFTIVITAVIGILVGVIVLVSLFSVDDDKIKPLYDKLNIPFA